MDEVIETKVPVLLNPSHGKHRISESRWYLLSNCEAAIGKTHSVNRIEKTRMRSEMWEMYWCCGGTNKTMYVEVDEMRKQKMLAAITIAWISYPTQQMQSKWMSHKQTEEWKQTGKTMSGISGISRKGWMSLRKFVHLAENLRQKRMGLCIRGMPSAKWMKAHVLYEPI